MVTAIPTRDGKHDGIFLQQANGDAARTSELLRSDCHQIYCRLEIKPLLSNPVLHLYNAKKHVR